MSDLLLLHAAEIATPPAGAARGGAQLGRIDRIEDGALVVESGVITRIGTTREILADARVTDRTVVLDAQGKAVIPGFVDAHTHLLYAGTRIEEMEQRLRGASYLQMLAAGGGILTTMARTRSASDEEHVGAMRQRLTRMLCLGTTTVEVKTGYGLSQAEELRCLRLIARARVAAVQTVRATFLGLHALRPDVERAAFLAEMDEALQTVAAENLADFADAFCEQGVFSVLETRSHLERAKALGLKLKLHADEVFDLGGARLAAELGCVSADHLSRSSADGLAAMRDAGVVAVLLPATAVFLGHEARPAASVRDIGLPVAAATDSNPGSSPTESMPLVMALLVLRHGFTPSEALTMVTHNAAHALSMGNEVGVLQEGARADFLMLDEPDYRSIVYRMGQNLVHTVVKGGRVVVRDHAMVMEEGGLSWRSS